MGEEKLKAILFRADLKFLQGILIFFILVLFLGCRVSSAEEISQLEQEIRVLNLINSLYLNPEQMNLLLNCCQEAVSLRKERDRNIEGLLSEKEELLTKIREELYSYKGELPSYLSRKFHQIKKNIDSQLSVYQKKIKKLIEKVKTVLNESQLYIVQNYQPCIIPPRGSLRIGQVEGSLFLERKLESLYNLPYEIYKRRRMEVVERLVKSTEIRFPRWKKKRGENIKGKLLEILDEMRKLSPVDFKLEKKKMARKIKELLLPQFRPKDLERNIEKFLLNSATVRVLTAMLSNSK